MAKIVSVHSFRGGTGKSNVTANVGVCLAKRGHRVGLIDTDIQSPGIHVIFGLRQEAIKFALNDYLWGAARIEDAAHDVGSQLGIPPGKLLLIPSSMKTGEISRVLREGYDVSLLCDGIRAFQRELKLDFLLIDTHPGINEETLLAIAISDVLLILLRPDSQDYQGTSITVEIADKLGAKKLLIVNKIPQAYDPAEVKRVCEETYKSEIIALFPHSDEVMEMASSGVFYAKYPEHEFSRQVEAICDRLVQNT